MNIATALLLFTSLCGSIASHEPLEPALEELAQQSACQGYHEDFIGLVEMIYGDGFLSQGGKASVERMIAKSDIENRKILDIGSGLGGPTLYLAEQYSVDITGLEPQKWLYERAEENLKKANLKGSARFVLMEHPSSLSQFADEAFDVVLSKETILHIPTEIKQAFFNEILRVLKPGGEIVVLDWMHTKVPYSQQTQKMMEMDGVAYHLITPKEYLTLLEDVGFSDVQMENITSETAGHSQKNIDRVEKLEAAISAEYGRDVYEYCLESWGYQRDVFASEELIAGIFRAKKNG